MRLVNSRLGLDIELKENTISVLIIENKKEMRYAVESLYNQCNGLEGDFILSDDKVLKMDKCSQIIMNPFSVDFNSKKIINALYSEMSEVANLYVEEKGELNKRIIELMDRILLSMSYSGIEYNIDFAWNEIFKLYGVKLEEQYSGLLEKTIEYIKVLSKLCRIRVLILVNYKAYFTVEELQEIYSQAQYNKVYIFMIESNEEKRIGGENVYIIDKDRCFIVK